jgi:hypothetical protein
MLLNFFCLSLQKFIVFADLVGIGSLELGCQRVDSANLVDVELNL